MPPRLPKITAAPRWICSSCQRRLIPSLARPVHISPTRPLRTSSEPEIVPFRKQFKDDLKKKKAEGSGPKKGKKSSDIPDGWELTVGIEIHAQLNTEHKLFSSSPTSIAEQPNQNVQLFDVALPGSQPRFQTATLLPAIRAALALNCQVQDKSSFDRKHYFYQDQPSGYQITQYYSPFAKDGHITLDQHDGLAPSDGDAVRVGIKQVQLEQDTAKTVQQPPDAALLDFNRAGRALVEIITLPHLRSPQAAAACARKVQHALLAVGAVTAGMELGGLRADVNVSVRRAGAPPGPAAYHGVAGLGTRTEIKNLSSFKAVEEAVVAEMRRQIKVLEGGGKIEGETRGWSLGSTETRKLRGKEGEVDYRYMPDPDLPPVYISQDLVEMLQDELPMLPDEQTDILVNKYGLTMKDAKTLVAADGGLRLDYFDVVVQQTDEALKSALPFKSLGKLVGNWVLHQIGGMFNSAEVIFTPSRVPPEQLTSIIVNLEQDHITGKVAKRIAQMIFNGDKRSAEAIISDEDLATKHLSDAEYAKMAKEVVEANPEMAAKVRGGEESKMQWFVGQLMRIGKGSVVADKAKAALEKELK